MRRRLLLVLVLASVMGLLASLMVYRAIRSRGGESPQASEKIVVAAVNMSIAETISEKQVKLVDWPKGSIPIGALKSVADANGRVVRSSIVAGEPLLDSKLASGLSGKGGIMPMLVPPRLRGVTIKVDDATRESGFILPGSHVDILVSMSRERGSQERVAKIILQDVAVLAAGQTVEMRDNKPVTVTTVTFALTPDQAERLALAQVEGKLMLATRNLSDKEIVSTSGVTVAGLLSNTPATPRSEQTTVALPPRPRGPAVAPSAPLPPPKIETHTVAVVRGSRGTEQVFVRDEAQQWIEHQKK
jgi:pilus assembly protein CpaB